MAATAAVVTAFGGCWFAALAGFARFTSPTIAATALSAVASPSIATAVIASAGGFGCPASGRGTGGLRLLPGSRVIMIMVVVMFPVGMVMSGFGVIVIIVVIMCISGVGGTREVRIAVGLVTPGSREIGFVLVFGILGKTGGDVFSTSDLGFVLTGVEHPIGFRPGADGFLIGVGA